MIDAPRADRRDCRNRKRFTGSWIIGVIALVVGVGGQGAWGQETVLEGVDVTSLPGNRLQLRFRLSDISEPPQTFTINDPARVVLDFANTRSGLTEPQQVINRGLAESINILEGGNRTRAAINLARLVPYDVDTQGNSVIVTLEAAGGNVGNAAAPPPIRAFSPSTTPAAAPAGMPAQSADITDIDFRRGPQGEAIITIGLSNPDTNVSVREEGDQIVAEFDGMRLPRGQERRLDVTDFATPVTLIDALNRGDNARITVKPTGLYEYLAYQTDDSYTIEVKPLLQEEIEDPDEQEYTGELLSLNFQDIEVRAVLQILADFTGLNIVVSDTVTGNLTLRLQNVPWDQALDIILRTKGLDSRQNGNVIYIAPTEELLARERLLLEGQRDVAELAPLRSEIIQVNYAKAAELGALLLANRGTEDESSLLSTRGNVTVDERTNTLLVQDLPEKLAEVRDLVTRLDVPVRQVLIDSRIVIARDDFTRELGVRYGFSGVQRNGDRGLASVAGSLGGTSTINQSAIDNLTQSGQPFPVAVPSLNDRLGVDLGVAGPVSLAFAILGDDYLLDLELSALQAEGRGEVLSNPRVITTDRREANILQGRNIPYLESDEGGGLSVAFVEALLELTVTPQITPDNRVIMDLAITKNEEGASIQTTLGAQPSIDRREVDTQVLVNNGETVVLGGVFEQITGNDLDKVPFLGDLPFVGNLFRRTVRANDRLELLIFVTPKVIDEGLAVR